MRFMILSMFLLAGCVSSDHVPDKYARILSQHYDIHPDGHFYYNYETENHISAEAKGTPKVLNTHPLEEAEVIEGKFSWTSPEGKRISVVYIGDEYGYRPQIQIS